MRFDWGRQPYFGNQQWWQAPLSVGKLAEAGLNLTAVAACMAQSQQDFGQCAVCDDLFLSVDVAPVAFNARSRSQFVQSWGRNFGHWLHVSTPDEDLATVRGPELGDEYKCTAKSAVATA
jgi:hypothetical protein